MELTQRMEIAAGLALIALIAAGCLLVIAPFVSSILWAAIICFATWPIHLRVERLCGRRRTLAAAIMTTLIVIVTVLPFVFSASALDQGIATVFTQVQIARAHGLPQPPDWIGRIPMIGPHFQAYWTELVTDSEKGHAFITMILDHFRDWISLLGVKFGLGMIHLCISVFIAFFFYRDGDRLVERVAEVGKRVIGDYSQHLVNVVGGTIRGVVYGFLGTALVQALLATIGFEIARVPNALLLGLLTFFLALVPFGPPLVWIPATAWLAAHDRSGMAFFMGLWGLLGISGIDHVLRPYLISREARLSFVLSFLGALGGVVAFGFIGIFLGPTLLAVGFALLQEFLHSKGSVTP